jgi:hypothetical protein
MSYRNIALKRRAPGSLLGIFALAVAPIALVLVPGTPAGAQTVPDPPTNVVASPGNGAATVSWTIPDTDGGSPITQYLVEGFSGTTLAAIGGCNGATCTSATLQDGSIIGSLSNGTSYTFQVVAQNSVGQSSLSAASAAIIVGAPSTPAGVTAAPGNGAATVSWAPSSDNGSTVTESKIKVLDKNGDLLSTDVCAGVCSSYAATGLTTGTKYQFEVKTENAEGWSPTSTASNFVKVGTPTSPTAVYATPLEGGATVSWAKPTHGNGNPVSGYVITALASDGTVAATESSSGSCGGNCTSLAMSDSDGSISGSLVDGDSYQFTVTAQNATGNSPTSQSSNAVNVGSGTDMGTCPATQLVTSTSASSTAAGSSSSNVADGNLGDSWSSETDSSASTQESLTFSWNSSGVGAENINQVDLYPAPGGLGIPTSFSVYYYSGGAWNPVGSDSGGGATAGQWDTINLSQQVSTTGIEIVSNTLSSNGSGGYAFEVAEATAGCSPSGANGGNVSEADHLLADDSQQQPNVLPSNEQPNLEIASNEIIQRATDWYDAGVPYNENEYYENPSDFYGDGKGDSPSPGGSPPAWREDCSGFVSYAWDFTNSDGGFTTYSFSSGDNVFTPNPYAYQIAWNQLQPGDALVYNGPTLGDGTQNHMVLFAGWNGAPGASSFNVYQEADHALGTIYSTYNMGDPVLGHFLPIRSYDWQPAGPPPPPPSQTVQIAQAADGSGYYILAPDGDVYAYGGAPFYGSAQSSYFSGQTAVALIVDGNGLGYWIVSSSGNVYAFGGAPYEGSAGSYFNGQTAVAAIASHDGNGYAIVSAQGNVYAFGDMPYEGGASQSYFSGQTAVALLSSSDGNGYAIVSNQGNVYAYGDMPYEGGVSQSYFSGQTAVGASMSPDGLGYYILSSSGNVYAFGDATYEGGPGGQPYFSGQSAISIATATGEPGAGYWIVSNVSNVYAYGSAPYEGGGT